MKLIHFLFNRGLIVLCSVLLVACASTVDSRVTTFQRWPADAHSTSGASFAFAPLSPEKATLEHLNYQNQIAQALQGKGLKQAQAGQSARFTVTFEPLTKTETQQVIERVRRPLPLQIYGSWGWYHRNRHGVGVNIGMPFFYPWFWDDYYYATAYTDRLVSVSNTAHSLKVTISEGTSKVFEASSMNIGTSPELSVVMPYLIQSIFADFPGTDGQTKIIEIDSETKQIKRTRIVQP